MLTVYKSKNVLQSYVNSEETTRMTMMMDRTMHSKAKLGYKKGGALNRMTHDLMVEVRVEAEVEEEEAKEEIQVDNGDEAEDPTLTTIGSILYYNTHTTL